MKQYYSVNSEMVFNSIVGGKRKNTSIFIERNRLNFHRKTLLKLVPFHSSLERLWSIITCDRFFEHLQLQVVYIKGKSGTFSKQQTIIGFFCDRDLLKI